MSKRGRKAQVTIFVIIAILIVAGIAGFFIVRGLPVGVEVPAELTPVYDFYISCAEANLKDGTKLLGSQAGYIEPPAFEPGSEYAPFSSELDFLGRGVPYWYYISGNGIAVEQVPTKGEMESQLARYLEAQISGCDFGTFEAAGFIIEAGDPSIKVEIREAKVELNMDQRLEISKGETSVVVRNHNTEIDSLIGGYYEIAKGIYDHEQRSLFLENYSVDVLNIYAPVTGFEVSCSPKFWNPEDVFNDLRAGLEANIQSIKIEGGNYELGTGLDRGYFVVDPGVNFIGDEQVNFLYSQNWASRFEVWPVDNNIMVARPQGLQEGQSAAGFCYVPYRFVYDMYFPVLIQILSSDGEEVFQFPMSVIISKNQPRAAEEVSEFVFEEDTVCDNANTDIEVFTLDNSLQPVEASVEFRCLTDVCTLGKTEIDNSTGEAVLKAQVPQCVNGVLVAFAEGFKIERQIISTNEESSADLVLEREYDVTLEVFVDGQLTRDAAVLEISENVDAGGARASVYYPDSPEFKLAQGDYHFDLKVYTSRPITLPENTIRTCVDAPREGFLGILGITDEECFEVTIPQRTIPSVLYAGGSQDQFVTESELRRGTLRVFAESVPLPTRAEDLQQGFDLINVKDLIIDAG